jgi:hypothetical protein
MKEAKIEGGGSDVDDRTYEREALRQRVVVLEPGVILVREVPVMTKFSVDVLFERERELAEGFDDLHMIIDLRKTAEPDAEIRAHLKKAIASLFGGNFHMALVTGKDHLMNTSVKFVIGKFGRPVTLHDTIEEALEGIHRGRGEL